MRSRTVSGRLVFGSWFLAGLFVAIPAMAQAGGGAAGSASASPAAAPSGAGAVESAIISYQATRQVAVQLASRFCKFTPYSGKYLLGTPANLSALQSARAFDEAVKQLSDQYKLLDRQPIGGGRGGPSLSLAITAGASAALTAITGAVNDIKTQTTQTASTFTPVDQVLFSELEQAMDGASDGKCSLVTTAYPKMIATAASDADAELDDLLQTQDKVRIDRHDDTATAYSADKELQGLDAQLALLEQTLGNETANVNGSNILVGKALTKALGLNYHVVTLSNAAAGGGTRVTTIFLWNVLFPAPRPSYNGGSAVAYTLRQDDGKYESADMVYFVYGYTKWDQQKMPSSENPKGFSNFKPQ